MRIALNCLGVAVFRARVVVVKAHATLRRNRRCSCRTRTVDPSILTRPASIRGWKRSRLSSNTASLNPCWSAICPKSAAKLHMICSMIVARIRSSTVVVSPRVTGDFSSAMASVQVRVSRAAWAKPCGNSKWRWPRRRSAHRLCQSCSPGNYGAVFQRTQQLPTRRRAGKRYGGLTDGG